MPETLPPPVVTTPDPNALVMKYSPDEARIATVRAEHEALIARLPALVEKEDLEPINAALKQIVPLRTQLEKARVDLKADALAFGRKVDAEAARLKNLILAFERPIQDAKEAIAKKERERAEAKVKAEEEAKAAEAKRLADIEAERKRVEDEQRAAAQKKLDEERAEFERTKREQEEKAAAEKKAADERQAALDAEAKKLKDEADALQRQKDEVERQKREAEDKVRREKDAAELKERLEKEAKEKAAADLAEKQRQERILAEREEAEKKAAEAARPDIDKIHAFGDGLDKLVASLFPQVQAGSRATQFLSEVRAELDAVADRCKKFTFPKRGK